MAPRRGPFRVLSVDGGGYLGLATAAFLGSVERHFGTRAADRFDLFCGTSTGAIIALALAAGKTADEVLSLYETLGRQVFWNPWRIIHILRKVCGLFSARYSNKPLATALQQAFGNTSLGDLRQRGKLVLITAFNVSTGRPRLFKTDHSPGLTTDAAYLVRDVALASAAAPTYLPMVALRSPTAGVIEIFCDGGVFATTQRCWDTLKRYRNSRWRPKRYQSYRSRRLGSVRPSPIPRRPGSGSSDERRVGKECRSRWSPYH